MDSPSSTSPVPTFTGEGFAEWSIKMKDHLISKGLWHLVKDGYQVPQSLETLTLEQLEALQVNRINDAKAFLLIRKSTALRISLGISNAETAKVAWDSLHEIFENNDASCAQEELPCARSSPRRARRVEKSHTEEDQMNEQPRASDEGPSSQPPIRRTQNMPNSDNPQFDVVLTKAAVRPSYALQFRARMAAVLPSKNMSAVVRCRGENYAIMFYGTRKQKGFGAGWKQLVDEHNLEKGDKLRFEVVTCSSYQLELKIQILSCDTPLERQQETRSNSDHDADGNHIAVVDDQDDDNEYIDVIDDAGNDEYANVVDDANDYNVVDYDEADDIEQIGVVYEDVDMENINAVDDAVDDDDIEVVDEEDDGIEHIDISDDDDDE